MGQYPQYLYVRFINPGTDDEFVITGTEPEHVGDDIVGDNESLSPTVARYKLIGTGEIHNSAPQYVENTAYVDAQA